MKHKHSRWARWRRNAAAVVDDLAAASADGALPVRLPEIARARKVREVVFRPLLMDGCLGVRKDGFVIFVRCEPRNSGELKRAWSADHARYRLLSPRMRFTIAHEIAHTFFFDVQTTPPRPTLDLKRSRTVSSLEQTCNHLAGRMLLPEPLLQKAIRKIDILDPNALRELAERSGVSPQVLIVRLKESFDWSGLFGAVLCVRQEQTGGTVISRAMHYSLRGILGGDREARPFCEFLRDTAFLLNGGNETEVRNDFPCSVGEQRATQKLVWRFEETTPVIGSTYFVTVKRAGDLQLLNPIAE